ncbi:MAG TPA: NADH-quinone oxidoreductase subunit C [Bryobacteraceae bacterium]|nr:NADH-quinone oxidoreductase subunit C [Bryobacteraceae bacterium]
MLPEALKDVAAAAALEQRDSAAIVDGHRDRDEPTLFIAPGKIVDVCRFFREMEFNRISSITGVDWYPADPRFEVVYHLHSTSRNERIRLKVRVREQEPEVESVTSVWRGANWYEREVFDMFGIRFRNHPDLRRILMPIDWEGHPLRKDYPVHGHKYTYQNE